MDDVIVITYNIVIPYGLDDVIMITYDDIVIPYG